MRLVIFTPVLYAAAVANGSGFDSDVISTKRRHHLRRDGDRAHHRRLRSGSGGDGDSILETGGSGPHPLLDLVDPDTNVNRQGSARPLELCQGDCITNDSCADDLVCFKRNNDFSPEEVPGCDGAARGNADYCVEAKYSQSFPELTFVGHRGPFGECAGDCDGDSDCMGDLVCYQQSGATDADDSVPGCPGTAQDNVDYCVDKKRLEKSGKYLNFVLQGDLEPGSLGRCQGDCDGDEDCKSGLRCFHRNDGAVPGCKGVAVTNIDYCVPGPPPTKRPTSPTPRPTSSPVVSIPPEESKDEDDPSTEKLAVPVPAPTEPAAPTTDSPDDPDDYPFSVFLSTAVLKEPEEDVVAVSETGDEAETEVPALEGRSSHESTTTKYADLSVIVSEVLNQLFSQAWYDVTNGALPNRRLVSLTNDGISSQTVPVISSAQGSASYVWIAFKTDFIVTDFSPNENIPEPQVGGGGARRVQDDNLDNQQLAGEDVENDVKSIVSQAIKDDTLLQMLKRRDPNVLGVSEFGQELSSDVDTSSILPPATKGTESGEPTNKQPWWVWFLVTLAGFALLVLTAFAVKRRNTSKDDNVSSNSSTDAPPDNGKGAILTVAPTFDNDDSDDEQNTPHWGDGSRLEDLSNQFGVHPFDDEPPPPPPPDLPQDSVLYRQHPELFLAANGGSHRLDTVEL